MDTSAVRTDSGGFSQINATRVIATTVAVVFAVGGMNHGLFEALQGNKPTNGSYIEAIGEGQRFWSLGNEPAFTIVPNFLWTGVLAMLVGLAIIVWAIWFLPRRHGPTVLLGLFVLLFLVGGGIAQVIFFIPLWAFATKIGKPLTWWSRVLPPRIRPLLSRIWPATLALSTVSILIGLEMAVFGYLPGVSDPDRIMATTMLFVLSSWIMMIVSFVAGFGHDLLRMQGLERGAEDGAKSE